MRLVIVICVLLSWPLTLAAATGDVALAHCDPDVGDLPNSPHGYRLRADRCEGLYHQPVSSLVLSIASFTRGPLTYELEKPDSLLLNWQQPAGLKGAVRLSARIFAKDRYYRMDTMRPEFERVYKWPMEILKAQRIDADELSLLCWLETTIGNVERPIYLPVSVKPTTHAESINNYILSIYPGVKLREIYVSIDQVDKTGAVLQSVQAGKPLGKAYYRAGRVQRVKLPELDPGIYYVEITGEERSGAKTSVNLWLYFPE